MKCSKSPRHSAARNSRAMRSSISGTGYTPSGWNTGHGSLDFNPKVFDKPAEIIGRLHWQHFKVILHVNNAPRTLHGEIPAGGR